MTTKKSDFTSAIGSKWLTYLPMYAWMAPLWIITSVLTSPAPESPGAFIALVGANVIAILIAALLFFLLRTTAWNPQRRLNASGVYPASVFIGSFLLGVTKAFFTVALSATWMGESLDALPGRLISAGALAAVSIPALSGLLHQLEVYRNERTLLIDEIVRRESNSETSVSNSAMLTDFVDHTIKQLKSQPFSGLDLADTLDRIRETNIRPLSHEIWKRESSRIPEFTIRSLITLSLSSLRFSYIPAAIFFAAIALARIVMEFGWAQGLTLLAIDLLVLLAAIGVMRLFSAGGIARGALVFVVVTAVEATAMQLISTALTQPAPLTIQFMQGATYWLLVVTVTIVGNVLTVIRQTSKTVRDELLRANPVLTSQEFVSTQAAISDRAIARLLHSEVQNEFLARALHIRAIAHNTEGADHLSEDFVTRQVQELSTYLMRLGTRGETDYNQSLNLGARLDTLARSWHGVARITVTLDGCGDLSNAEIAAVCGVVNEAISNSIRHGLARTIAVVVRHRGSQIQISVDDDGLGARRGKPGLGTNLLNAFGGSQWNLGVSPSLGGAHLFAVRKSEASRSTVSAD